MLLLTSEIIRWDLLLILLVYLLLIPLSSELYYYLYMSYKMGCFCRVQRGYVYPVKSPMWHTKWCLIQSNPKFSVHSMFRRRDWCYPISIFSYCGHVKKIQCLNTFNLLRHNFSITSFFFCLPFNTLRISFDFYFCLVWFWMSYITCHFQYDFPFKYRCLQM